jgi:hypothetical protein
VRSLLLNDSSNTLKQKKVVVPTSQYVRGVTSHPVTLPTYIMLKPQDADAAFGQRANGVSGTSAEMAVK